MALSNGEVCLHSLCFAVSKKTFKIMQELENFSWHYYRTYDHHHPDITATMFGDCASKIWYRLIMSNLLIVDY